MNEESVARGFDRIAAVYDFFVRVVFGDSIHLSQIHFFQDLPICENALIIGGGTGKIVPPLLATKKVQQITYIDLSAKMISKAKKRVAEKDVVQFICGTHLDIPNKARYDLIITPFFLDCFNQQEMEEVMKKISSHHTQNGIWLFSDFTVSKKNGFWKFCSKVIVKTLYAFFNWSCKLGVKKLPNFMVAFEKLSYFTAQTAYYTKGIFQSRWLQKSDL